MGRRKGRAISATVGFLRRCADAIGRAPNSLSVEFPVGDVRAENNSFEGPREEPFPRPPMVSFRSAQTSTATRGASMPNLEIMWTKVDEAPALATYSLLPI